MMSKFGSEINSFVDFFFFYQTMNDNLALPHYEQYEHLFVVRSVISTCCEQSILPR